MFSNRSVNNDLLIKHQLGDFSSVLIPISTSRTSSTKKAGWGSPPTLTALVSEANNLSIGCSHFCCVTAITSSSCSLPLSLHDFDLILSKNGARRKFICSLKLKTSASSSAAWFCVLSVSRQEKSSRKTCPISICVRREASKLLASVQRGLKSIRENIPQDSSELKTEGWGRRGKRNHAEKRSMADVEQA